MTILTLAALLLAGSAAATRPPPPADPRQKLAQITVRERVIIRVQTLAPLAAPSRRSRETSLPKPLKWKERKGKKCVAVAALAGASVTQEDSVDLRMRDGSRLRARLESSCPALDFYSGFYLKPTKDGRICADRDTIYSRSGGHCEITAFRKLVATP